VEKFEAAKRLFDQQRLNRGADFLPVDKKGKGRDYNLK
jgi:hypothetical protein